MAFRGQGSSGQVGIYTFMGGTLALVADRSTAIPGGSGTFTNFDNPVSLGGGDVAFIGFGFAQVGIYNALIDMGEFSLNINIIGKGNGTVTSNPEGINCPEDCTEDYMSGEVVTLDPIPGKHSKFKEWTGDPDCEDSTVTMDSDKTCNANFSCAKNLKGFDTTSASINTLIFLLPALVIGLRKLRRR